MFDAPLPHGGSAAAIDFVPLLFLAYVVYAIFSAIAKAAKQPRPQPPDVEQPLTAQPTQDQIKAALAQRIAAAAAARRAAAAPRAPSAAPAPRIVMLPARDAGATRGDDLAPLVVDADGRTISSARDLAGIFAALPAPAQAILAGAIVGPCAAHRGGGHVPEDW